MCRLGSGPRERRRLAGATSRSPSTTYVHSHILGRNPAPLELYYFPVTLFTHTSKCDEVVPCGSRVQRFVGYQCAVSTRLLQAIPVITNVRQVDRHVRDPILIIIAWHSCQMQRVGSGGCRPRCPSSLMAAGRSWLAI